MSNMVDRTGKIIYKYTLESFPEQIIKLPIGSKVLTVQVQNIGGDLQPKLWVLANWSQNEQEDRIFRIYPTGIDANFEDCEYIGTFQLNLLVWHLFEYKSHE